MGRPAKKDVKEEETCLSLNFPKNVSCCHCLRSQSEMCEKAWAKEKPISDEEIKAYIDAWLILNKIGFRLPLHYSVIKKRKKWKPYIIACDKLLKEYEPPEYQSLPNPDTTPTKKPSAIPSTLAILRSAIKTPIDHLKSIIRGTNLPKVRSPSSKSSSHSSPEPASPTEPLDTIKTPTKKLFAEEPPLSPDITDFNNQWEDESNQPNNLQLSESLSSGDESDSLPYGLITEYTSNQWEENDKTFQPNDPHVPWGLGHQIQSQDSVCGCCAPSAPQFPSQVSSLYPQIDSQALVCGYCAPSASQTQPQVSSLYHNDPQVTGGLVHQILSQESVYHAPSASEPQPQASALYHNGAALDWVNAERHAERPPSINNNPLSESLSSGDESDSLPYGLITEYTSNQWEENDKTFQPNDPHVPWGLGHQIQSQDSVCGCCAPSAPQFPSQVSSLYPQIDSQALVCGYCAPSASQTQPQVSSLYHNDPQVTGGLVHQILSQESVYHAPSASEPQPQASALYHNGAALDWVNAERHAERPPSINIKYVQGTHSKHPMLNSMGIESSSLDDSDKGRISDLISEIVDVCRINDIPLDFKYKGNYRPARLFSVPRCSTEESFQKVQKGTGWLTKLLAYVAEGSDETGPNKTAEWILDYLGKEFEDGFYKIANRMGLHYGKQLMCPIATSAMIADANITLMQFRTIVRHMTNYFGRSIMVSIDKVRSVTDGWEDVLTPPVFTDFKFRDKDNDKKKPEIVKIWVRDPLEAMAYDMKLVIEEMRKNGGPRQFGYLLDNLKKGVNVLVGSDHGIGSLQLLAKLLYLSALYRKETGKIEEGTRVTQYGSIVCKKDKEPIMAQVAPTTEKAITELETSMMIGVEDEDENIDVVCIPKNVRDVVRTSVSNGIVELCWPIENGETKRIHLKHLTSKGVSIWDVIENFYYNISGDIAYFFTMQGRDGSSSCKCPYCDLKIGDWKKSRRKGNLLTIETLRECEKTHFAWVKDCEKAEALGKRKPKKPDTLGVCGKLHCSADPQRYILPILHLLTGLFNKSF